MQNNYAVSNGSVFISFFAIALLSLALIPSDASSATLGLILCKAYWAVSGSVIRGLATLAVLSLGVGALFGKVSWALSVMVAVGIGTVMGASELASLITGVGCDDLAG